MLEQPSLDSAIYKFGVWDPCDLALRAPLIQRSVLYFIYFSKSRDWFASCEIITFNDSNQILPL